MQDLDGRSLLPLLEETKYDWPDRELFVNCGRWPPGERDAFKYVKCAVRTERWRFSNNEELFDISVDPGETNDVAAMYPEVVEQLRKKYDLWWDSTLPLLVNEGLPRVKEHPLAIRYQKQLEERGIPEWAPDEI